MITNTNTRSTSNDNEKSSLYSKAGDHIDERSQTRSHSFESQDFMGANLMDGQNLNSENLLCKRTRGIKKTNYSEKIKNEEHKHWFKCFQGISFELMSKDADYFEATPSTWGKLMRIDPYWQEFTYCLDIILSEKGTEMKFRNIITNNKRILSDYKLDTMIYRKGGFFNRGQYN